MIDSLMNQKVSSQESVPSEPGPQTSGKNGSNKEDFVLGAADENEPLEIIVNNSDKSQEGDAD